MQNASTVIGKIICSTDEKTERNQLFKISQNSGEHVYLFVVVTNIFTYYSAMADISDYITKLGNTEDLFEVICDTI